MANEFLKSQIGRMGVAFEVDGKTSNAIPDDFKEIVFKKNNQPKEICVSFSDYIVNPYPGFDLHEKWNNGIAPPRHRMYGEVIEENSSMIKVNVHTDDYEQNWCGWCPKKSCVVINYE